MSDLGNSKGCDPMLKTTDRRGGYDCNPHEPVAGVCCVCHEPARKDKAMKEHDLKCWPSAFQAVKRGVKPFELRKDDRGYEVGDVLVLREFNPAPSGGLSGDVVRRRVTWITVVADWVPQFPSEHRWVVLGIEPVS